MNYILIFNKILEVYPGPCICAFFILGWCVYWTVCIIYPALVSTSLLWAEWRGGSSHLFFLSRMARSDSDQYCFVLQGVNQQLGCFLAMASHPCPIWIYTWGLHSVLAGPLNFLSNVFRRRLRNCRKIFWSRFQRFWKGGLQRYRRTCWLSLREMALYVPSNLLMGSLILTPPPDHMTTHLAVFFLGGSWLYITYLWWKGIRNFWREYSALSWGICYLPYSSHDGEGLDGMLDSPKGPQFSWRLY